MSYLKYLPLTLVFLAVVYFAAPFILQHKLPIPTDTIVGLYHPFRDLYATDYPRGIPYKNFLITDPVRQQYPWRMLAIELLKHASLPLWNPYSMSGMPLLANIQSAAFYPLNILFLLLPFSDAWSFLILLQPLLAGLFLFFYLRNLRISPWAAALGAIAFAFSGFSISWLEWNTVVHTGLWLPLILFTADKIISTPGKPAGTLHHSFSKNMLKGNYLWILLFIFSLLASFFAGHLQTFFYVFFVSFIYTLFRWIQFGKNKHTFFIFVFCFFLFVLVSIIQWFPTLQFLQLSARNIDLNWQVEGWFLPWQHLTQFVVPDFFGNPATLNYWGVWNYGEFIGYVGIIPLMFALYALFFRYDKKTLFFGSLLFISLFFSLPTPLAKLPYQLQFPFIATAQPTRLLFIIDFCLAILTAFGLDYFIIKKTKIIFPIVFLGSLIFSCWLFVLLGNKENLVEQIAITKRNLYLPTILFGITSSLLVLSRLISKKYQQFLPIFLIIITIFDLIRFTNKFNTFTTREYLYPQTRVTKFLQKNLGYYRYMTTDPRILPPNFSIVYKLQTVDGYDPLYLRSYGELIAASERNKPDIRPPFGFNRILTPHMYNSKIIDLLGVKYIVSLTDLSSPRLQKILQEGETRVYENSNTAPRAFFVSDVVSVSDKKQTIETMFASGFSPIKQAVIENSIQNAHQWTVGNVRILSYEVNAVTMQTENNGNGFLVFSDTYYPTWHALIDNNEVKIQRTDYNFRGITVPAGKHIVTFYNTLF
jgi:hypothetical protein